jgi:hypothetical protein
MKSAVITADIVNSTRLKKADASRLMKALASALSGWQHEFFRGDSFQVLVPQPADALRLLLQLRTLAIRLNTTTAPVDIRASIGIASVKQPVKKLQTATDEAFVLSGRAFDGMEKDQRLVITCPEKNSIAATGLEILADFIDYLFRRLTAKQAFVVSELLSGKNQLETARSLKKSQATVHKHTQAAGWPEMEKLMKQYQLLAATIET